MKKKRRRRMGEEDGEMRIKMEMEDSGHMWTNSCIAFLSPSHAPQLRLLRQVCACQTMRPYEVRLQRLHTLLLLLLLLLPCDGRRGAGAGAGGGVLLLVEVMAWGGGAAAVAGLGGSDEGGG